MMTFDVDWVDAFSDRPFGGNGCAVVHGGAVLDPDTATAFVRETSLVECTFTGPSEIADICVRYFLASREIPFAGHPTVATVAAMRHRGMIKDGPLTLETGAGIVAVEVNGAQVSMTQIAPKFGAHVPAEIVASVGGIAPSDILHPPRFVSTGLPFCITVVKDRAVLEAARFDMEAFRGFLNHLGVEGTDTMEPFWVTLSDVPDAGDTYARLLMAPPSPAEDPFTGSATGAMAAYLWAEGLIKTPKLSARQGHGLGRPGQAQVEVLGARDAITGVVVAGAAHVLMSGELHL
ncbi:PhzF family phenazine biosynthesis protein [Tateyamaria sp. Alg231-49]|uniref:PhzF family phenazine biosynthesis protein n=1 Tax=Tateyamaria sp. Alg231-49 TaxID=1922219 RepID=UPI0019006831|nr:PhzF family phenazine biosynthesis protein [Tateyamaria sp. Alg231-49]